VPKDCAVLIIAGPSKEPPPEETAAIDRYLQAGGKAIALVDPPPGAGLTKLLDRWGVSVRPDLIVDPSGGGRLFRARPTIPLVTEYDGAHPITRSFRQATFYPFARSVFAKENPVDAQVWPLAQAGRASFAEPHPSAQTPVRLQFNPATDRRGPIVLAVAVTRPAKGGKEARMVVVGDSDFISNAFFDQVGNGEFFLACMNWLAEAEDLIAIRPRTPQDRRIQLTDAQERGMFWLVVVAMPLAALSLGIAVHWRRR
jgi:ABC-type uncharacterized transport system involved in gliding motility auxiliary subunit